MPKRLPPKLKICLLGQRSVEEQRYLLDKLYADLTQQAGDLVAIEMPVEIDAENSGYTLSAMEHHYEQVVIFEEADLVVSLIDQEFDTGLWIGIAFGLRKQIITFAPRGDVLRPSLNAGPVMLNITADPSLDGQVPFNRGGVISLDYEALVDSAMQRLVVALKSLHSVYTVARPQFEMAFEIAHALKTKWGKNA